jgi:hypothetical protein
MTVDSNDDPLRGVDLHAYVGSWQYMGMKIRCGFIGAAVRSVRAMTRR